MQLQMFELLKRGGHLVDALFCTSPEIEQAKSQGRYFDHEAGKFVYMPPVKNPDTMGTIVGEALGAASMCWEPKPTGVFESEQCEKVHSETMRKLAAWKQEKPLLGLATTIELIRELDARARFGGYADYRPAGEIHDYEKPFGEKTDSKTMHPTSKESKGWVLVISNEMEAETHRKKMQGNFDLQNYDVRVFSPGQAMTGMHAKFAIITESAKGCDLGILKMRILPGGKIYYENGNVIWQS